MTHLLSAMPRLFARPSSRRQAHRRPTYRPRLRMLEDRLAPATLITLASFDSSTGGSPMGGLVEDSHGNLFGTASGGGAYGDGTVFELAAGSGTITTLASFNGDNGRNPTGDLAMDSQGNLYGTTYAGGTYSGQNGNGDQGTVFELPNGSNTITDLVSFYYYYNSPDDNGYPLGDHPSSGLYEDSQGNLFGTTEGGGGSATNPSGGTVFEIASGTHTFTQLAYFPGPFNNDYSPPWAPCDPPIEDNSGNLFGMTTAGGGPFPGVGAVYELTASAALRTLATFNGPNGANATLSGNVSTGRLLMDSQGNIFGTTQAGGASWDGTNPESGYGTVFEIANGSNTITTLVSFDATTNSPAGGLIMDSQGNLYGTTIGGGVYNWGQVFEIGNGSNTLTTLASFNYNAGDGTQPIGDLLLDSHGNLFGVTMTGGATGNGTVFEVVTDPVPTAAVSGPSDGYHGVQGQTRSFTVSATSTSTDDTAAGFTYAINWGDGSQVTTVPASANNGSGVNADHIYSQAGSYTISITATDQYGTASPAVTTTESILTAEQQGSGLALGGGLTTTTWTLTQASPTTLTVKLGAKSLGTFTASDGVQVFGQAALNKLTLNGTSADDTFTVNGAAATMNGFTFGGTSIGGWTFGGLGGNNTLTVLETVKGTPIKFVGGTGGTNTLVGPNVPSTWTLNGPNAGSLATVPATAAVSFSQVQDLVGGTAANVFKFTKTTAAYSQINGGGPGSWLDYAAFPSTSPVRVDLTQGTATNVANGVSNIQNVRGGAGDDTLIGSGGNILVGGGGNDTLTDAYNGPSSNAQARSLLLGGLGGDTLTAGSADDILVSGNTSYDTNNTALMAILKEWQSSDSYTQRFDSLQGLKGSGTGSHLNGSYKLIWRTKVLDDGVPDTLIGTAAGAGLDWFFASYPNGTDNIVNFDAPGDEYLNNAL